ncbi:PIN domain-containing protein [Candidatus Woesearchaeota archaeon]|nr:PIN domain-containing protein [Candidatus Woesearchaeota archaeon]
MFADTDFLLALVKPSDWLKGNAVDILKGHKEEIITSVSCLLEFGIVCQRIGLNVVKSYVDLFALLPLLEEHRQLTLEAAFYVEKYHFNIFDAFHASFCGDGIIISSDKIYDKIGLKRVPLEKD